MEMMRGCHWSTPKLGVLKYLLLKYFSCDFNKSQEIFNNCWSSKISTEN